jgi:hypothetical protein
MDGRVVDEARKPSTSMDVIRAANHTLNQIVKLVEYVQTSADSLARLVESDIHVLPAVFNLSVVSAGSVVVLRDESTGVEFLGDGDLRSYRATSSAGLRQLP